MEQVIEAKIIKVKGVSYAYDKNTHMLYDYNYYQANTIVPVGELIPKKDGTYRVKLFSEDP